MIIPNKWYIQCGPPSDVNVGLDSLHEYYSYLSVPSTIVSYWSYVHLLNAIDRGPHIVLLFMGSIMAGHWRIQPVF